MYVEAEGVQLDGVDELSKTRFATRSQPPNRLKGKILFSGTNWQPTHGFEAGAMPNEVEDN